MQNITKCLYSDILRRVKKTIKKKLKIVSARNCCALTFLIPVRRAPDPPSGIFLYYNDSKMPSCKQYHNVCCLVGKPICDIVTESHNLGLERFLLGFFLPYRNYYAGFHLL